MACGRWRPGGRGRPSTGPWTSPGDAHTSHRPGGAGDGLRNSIAEIESRGARARVARFRFPHAVGDAGTGNATPRRQRASWYPADVLRMRPDVVSVARTAQRLAGRGRPHRPSTAGGGGGGNGGTPAHI